MGWLARKFDNLGATLCGGGGALGASMAPAFANAYLQRLGGRLDEARTTLENILSGKLGGSLAEADKLALIRDQGARIQELDQSYRQISTASPLERPLRLLLDFDSTIARQTLHDFVPALSLDSAGVLWAVAGLIMGFLVWDLLSLPFSTSSSRHDGITPMPRRRREPRL